MFARYLTFAVVFVSLVSSLLACVQTQEGGGCSVFCPCRDGLQCQAGIPQRCWGPAQLGQACHLTHHCDKGLYCASWEHVCKSLGTVGQKCRPAMVTLTAGGQRCNTQAGHACDPFSRTCIAPSQRGNICGFVGAQEDRVTCASGLTCQCNRACSIRNMLRSLQGAISGVAATIQDLVGKTTFCCKCV